VLGERVPEGGAVPPVSSGPMLGPSRVGKEVRKVWKGKVLKSFVCDEENLELDYLLFGELLKDDVVVYIICKRGKCSWFCGLPSQLFATRERN